MTTWQQRPRRAQRNAYCRRSGHFTFDKRQVPLETQLKARTERAWMPTWAVQIVFKGKWKVQCGKRIAFVNNSCEVRIRHRGSKKNSSWPSETNESSVFKKLIQCWCLLLSTFEIVWQIKFLFSGSIIPVLCLVVKFPGYCYFLPNSQTWGKIKLYFSEL